ncbi:DUF1566 domain-containing protein [bacterium]|nr:DUF1566 domain-containing protein [bacterium]MBU1957380.1 DUF1566 domain-containing protein [bacterium]
MRTILLIMIGLSSLLTADFTRDANGIVTDSTTGLAWQDDSIGSQMNWQSAIDNCEALTLGGHEDWRLPNLNELTSLVDDREYNPSIDDVFQNTASNYYWSSTTYANYSYYAWCVYFSSGLQGNSYKSHNNYVRCVRAGQ